jgi:hypothetical protein
VKVTLQHDTYCVVEVNESDRTIKTRFTYLPPTSSFKLNDILTQLDPSNEHCIVIGDMNARIGNNSDVNSKWERKSKDAFINPRGRELIHFLSNSNMSVLNGATRSDQNGEYTFVNKNGSSVIDLCLISDNIQEDLDLKVLHDATSLHFPILFSLDCVSLARQGIYIPKITWNNEKTSDFHTSLKEKLQHEQEPSLTSFHNIMTEALHETGMMSRKLLGNQAITRGPRLLPRPTLFMQFISHSWVLSSTNVICPICQSVPTKILTNLSTTASVGSSLLSVIFCVMQSLEN